MKAKKSPKFSLEKRRMSFFAMGLLVACALPLVAFEWTTYDPIVYNVPLGEEEIDLTELPPITIPEKKKIVRPKNTRVDFTKPPELVDNNTVIDTTITLDQPLDTTPLVAYDPSLFGDDDDDGTGTVGPPAIFVIVENMPCWTGCKYKEEDKRKDFTDKQIFRFLSENVKYPRMCVDGRIEGVVWVEYVVNQEGYVADAKVIRGAHKLLDKEALRVVNNFPQFTPGKQRTKPVNVKFTLPIRFTLNN